MAITGEKCNGTSIYLEGVTRPEGLAGCPLCGRAPGYLARASTHTEHGEYHAVMCYCGGYSARVHCGGDTQAEAVAQWNTRAPAAATAAQPDHQWIPVSERMPEPRQAVLCAVEFDRPGDWRIKVGGYAPDYPEAHKGWHIHGASWVPTHWMPLPDAPATGATGG